MGRLLILATIMLAGFAGFGLFLGGHVGGPEQASAIAPATPPSPPEFGPRVVALKGDARGHFLTDAQINGRFTRVLVDTGASIIALSAEDASAAGITPMKSAFTARMQTANGIVAAARVQLSEVRLQSIVLRDVEAVIMPPGAMRGTLLGMSFLRRLQSFEMKGGSLLLKQ